MRAAVGGYLVTFIVFALLVNLFTPLLIVLNPGEIRTRILAVNLIGTISACFIAAFSLIQNEPLFIDISMLYACINFISTMAFMRFFLKGSLHDK